MMFRLLPILLFSMLLIACGDDSSDESQPSSEGTSPAAEDTPSASTEAEAEATEVPSEGAGEAAEAPPAEGTPVEGSPAEGVIVAAPTGPPRNLFTDVDIRLGVSSVTGVTTHGPANMVDGDMDTYWRSSAGDAVGSWVGFRIPDDVGVSKIRIVGGRPGEANAWASGPRIRKVEVFHNGESKGEFTLSAARPGFHDIEVEGVGGLWQVVVKSLTGNATGDATVSVAEFQVIGATGEHTMEPYLELAERCRVGAVDSLFGEPALRSAGMRPAGSRDLAPGYSYGAEQPNADALYTRLAQGIHLGPTLPLRAIEYNAANNAGKILFLIYGVDSNTPAQALARRSATRTQEDGKSCYQPDANFVQCLDMHIARFSLPRGGVASYDGGMQTGGDTCRITEVDTTLRDFDGDDTPEILIELDWQGTSVCGMSPTPGAVVYPEPPRMHDEIILNLDTAMSQFQSTLTSTAPFGELNLTRSMRDANDDGKQDIVLTGTTQRCTFEDASGQPTEPQCTVEESTTNFFYVEHIDAWIREGEEVPPPPPEPSEMPPPTAPEGAAPGAPSAANPSAPAAPAAAAPAAAAPAAAAPANE